MSTESSLLQTPTARVRAIHCQLFPPHVLRRISAVHVTEPELIDRLRQMPNPNGMLDLNMGPSHRGLGCSTCANDHLECQGHLGHIELPLPCFGAAMIRQIYSLVKVLCPFCCRVMLTQQERDQLKTKTERFLSGLVAQSTFSFAVKQAKSKKLCPHTDCQMPQPKFELDGGMIFWKWEHSYDIDLIRRTGWGELLERPFTAREALEIFEHVPADDWRLLGFSPEASNPAWSIYTCVAVLPNCLRPVDRQRNHQHDITLLGEEIVRKVQHIKKLVQEKLPEWVPRSVQALNHWLDEALSTLERHGLLLANIDETRTQMDASEMVNFATMRAHEIVDSIQPQPGEPAKKSRAHVRRQTKVSFLQTAFCAAQGMQTGANQGRISSKIASTMELGQLPGHKWSDCAIPGHILAGWSNLSFAQLVAAGPRENVLSDWIRLVPFVMWAACYCVPEFIQVAGKPEIVESLYIPNDETAGWLVQQADKLAIDLQQSVIRMISNDGRVVPKAVVHSGRFLASLMSHMQGKEGWFRMFMCGKRVDFSARSVITPGAQLDAIELGVPVSIAKVLTLPERVLPFTRRRLQEAVVNGHSHARGATRVVEPAGRIHYLEFIERIEDRIALAERLQLGWVVERTLRDGDFTLFNRQPSLHRMSIQGQRIKVLEDYEIQSSEDKIIKTHSSRKAPLAYALSMVTAGYFNADCDGDEMNQHMPQTAMSQMEVRHLFNVESIYLTPQAHRAGIGLIQNGLLLAYLITCKDVMFDERQKSFLESACRYGVRDCELLPAFETSERKLWTGKQLVSQTFSPTLDLAKTVDFPSSKLELDFDEALDWPKWARDMMHPAEHIVVIQDGILLCGRLCSKTVGKSAMSVVDLMVRDVSRRAATKFLSDVQRMLENYMTLRGFSTGMDDCVLSERAKEAIAGILDSIDKLPVAAPLAHGYEGTDDYSRREYALRVATQKIIDMANSVMLDDLMQTKRARENAFLAMIVSGAKGKIMNLQSIFTCIGQIVVNGVRVNRSIAQGRPFYIDGKDTSARSCGFLRNTFTQGIQAQEIIGSFFAGRESLVDTGINTSRTGYAYRRIIKGIENQRVALDGSVRDGQYMVQRVYGGTGANPEWFETVTVKSMCLSKEELRARAIEMFVTKPAEDGESFKEEELQQVEEIACAWHRAAVCVKEFSLNPFVHDSNTPIKSNQELKTIVVVPFERLMSKYLLSKVVDMERFTVCYDFEERQALEAMLQDPEEAYMGIFGLYLQLDRDMAEQGGAGASAPNRLHMWESLAALVASTMQSNQEEGQEANQEASQEANQGEYDKEWDAYLKQMARCSRALIYTYADARTRWIRSRIEPGEQCGILAAQSIGEPTTQMTMNTHHNVGRGSENLQMGVPRMTEILDMTVKMKTPVMVVFPKEQIDVDMLGGDFKGAMLTQLLKQVEVIMDEPGQNGELTCVPEDKEWMRVNRDFFGPDCDDEDVPVEEGKFIVASTRDYVIRYELDADKVRASQVDIVEIACKLREAWAARPENTWESIYVTFTPVALPSRIFVVRLRCTGVRCVSMEAPSRQQKTTTQRYLGSFLRRLALYSQRQVKFGLSTSLRGVTVHKKAVCSDVEEGVASRMQGVLTTRGTCLGQLQTIDRVEWRKCLTNDILETYDLLGIGAARTLIVQELTKIMSCDGTYVAFPHVWAVADCIVFRGFPMRFSRHGQNRVDTSILQRASFEESAEQLVNAAMFSETDPLQGITPNLILGQVIPAGTGSIGVHSDRTTKGGMETLAPAASIDLSLDQDITMNPKLVAHSTMEQTDRDRVDARTGLMRPWTRRLRREHKDGVEQRVARMAARQAESLGLQRPFEKKRAAREWMSAVGKGRISETSGSTLAMLYGQGFAPREEERPRGRKRVTFEQDEDGSSTRWSGDQASTQYNRVDPASTQQKKRDRVAASGLEWTFDE